MTGDSGCNGTVRREVSARCTSSRCPPPTSVRHCGFSPSSRCRGAPFVLPDRVIRRQRRRRPTRSNGRFGELIPSARHARKRAEGGHVRRRPRLAVGRIPKRWHPELPSISTVPRLRSSKRCPASVQHSPSASWRTGTRPGHSVPWKHFVMSEGWVRSWRNGCGHW